VETWAELGGFCKRVRTRGIHQDLSASRKAPL
jgi:hypothetical protein